MKHLPLCDPENLDCDAMEKSDLSDIYELGNALP